MTYYFLIDNASYPLGITYKFIKKEIKYIEQKHKRKPVLSFCRVDGERKNLTKKEFLKQVKYYEDI